MTNIETLMDSMSQIVTDYKTEPAEKNYFSTIDLKYAYSALRQKNNVFLISSVAI